MFYLVLGIILSIAGFVYVILPKPDPNKMLSTRIDTWLRTKFPFNIIPRPKISLSENQSPSFIFIIQKVVGVGFLLLGLYCLILGLKIFM